MKQNYFTQFSKYLLLIFYLGLFIQCSKDDDKNEKTVLETFTLTSRTTDVLPLQAIIVESDIEITAESYPAQFGNEEIEVFKTSDGKLLFPIPDVAAGNYDLNIKIGEKEGSLTFHVEQSELTEETANEIIQQELKNPLLNYENELNVLAVNTNFSEDIHNQILSSKSLLINYFSTLETISPQEKIQLARFYKANPYFTTDYLNVQARGWSNPEYDCFKVNRNKVILTVISVVAFVDLLPKLVAAGPWGSIGALVGLVAGVTAAVCIISASQEILINDCFYPYKHFLMDESGAVENFTITNAQDLVVSVKSLNKGLTLNDINSSNTFVSTVASKLNMVKAKWTTIKNGINSIVSSASGWFSNWFNSSSFTGITFDFPALPNSSPETETETNTDYISIEDIASDIIASVNKSGSSLTLNFEVEPSSLPRTITGNLKYDDGDFISENSFSVTLQDSANCWGLDLTITVNNGTATATASGGEPPYNYSWSTGDSGPSVSGLEPGFYLVTVTDSNGCVISDFALVPEE